jgi:hypothetical protein
VIADVDDDYRLTAARLRELATSRNDCLDFSSCSEHGQEIALSHWPELDSIRAWRDDPAHWRAQAQGIARWYRSHRVDIAEIGPEP